MSLANAMFNDVANGLDYLFKPKPMNEDTRKSLAWGGIIGVVAAAALKALGFLSAGQALFSGALSASIFVGALTTIPVFVVVPTIICLASLALSLGVAMANIDPSQVHFVFHLN